MQASPLTTHSGIPLRLTCSRAGTIYERCSNSWGIIMFGVKDTLHTMGRLICLLLLIVSMLCPSGCTEGFFERQDKKTVERQLHLPKGIKYRSFQSYPRNWSWFGREERERGGRPLKLKQLVWKRRASCIMVCGQAVRTPEDV